MGRKLRSWVNPNNRDPFVCCIACGVFLECPDPETVFQEREEWKQFLNATSAVKIKAEKLETMCFKKGPLLWMGFYRASMFFIFLLFVPFEVPRRGKEIYTRADRVQKSSTSRKMTISEFQGSHYTV